MAKHKRQQGFSLIEIMVGLVIGLLATLVIMNVFSVFEEQKRTTAGGSDAQTNGSIALYNIQRDIQQAGFGLPVFNSEFTPFDCPVTGVDSPTIDHDNNPAASSPPVGISPVVLVDGVGVNGSDSLAIRAGDSMRGGVDSRMETGTAGFIAEVDSRLSCVVGDVALIVNSVATSCNMTRVNSININPMTGVARITLANNKNIAVGNSIACLGIWNEFQYAVNANNELTRTGSLVGAIPSNDAVPVMTEIVNLQAQYGISAAPNSNQITQWVNPTGAWASSAITTINRNRIKAVRVAIVARDGLLQRNNVTNACSSLTDANPTGLCAWDGSITGSPAPAINLANADWQQYRYKVFESIIPMRNIIWSKDKL